MDKIDIVLVVLILIGVTYAYSFDDVYDKGYEIGYDSGNIAGYNAGAAKQVEDDNVILIGYYNEIDTLNQRIKQKSKIINDLRQKRYDLPTFLQTANSVANSHNYSIPDYVCVDFTRDLVSELRKQGYDAHSERVTVDCDSGVLDENSCKQYKGKHVITEIIVYIESTNGYLIEPEYYEDYGIR